MFNWLKKKKNDIVKIDELIFYYQYFEYYSYSSRNKNIILPLIEIFEKFRKQPEDCDVYIKNEYNGVAYPMFDLDTIEHKETFEEIYFNTPYVLFKSSTDHYWGILGVENKNITTDTYWLSCNDPKFVKMNMESDYFKIRGLYDKLNRKPHIHNINGKLSDNFQAFIDKMVYFYNNEALELSILKHKDPQMILKFDRKRKLDQIEQFK